MNVLIEGTTYMDMFTPGEYYLFRRKELVDHFADWMVEVARYDNFPAPGNTAQVALRKPACQRTAKSKSPSTSITEEV